MPEHQQHSGDGSTHTPAANSGPTIIKRKKALSVSPLKASSTLGATLAFLGMNRCIPMLHGSQGCTAFGKIFFIQHFRDPMPMQTTAMDQVSTIMGGDDSVVEGLKTLCEKHSPAVIGVPTTGLVETQGADVRRAVRSSATNIRNTPRSRWYPCLRRIMSAVWKLDSTPASRPSSKNWYPRQPSPTPNPADVNARSTYWPVHS
jgi:nitrogenase molybdenum-iron protein alpha/beta subunit